MPSSFGGGLSRVTVVAPDTRMDLALPSDLPLADLLPTLLFHAGRQLADEGLSHGGWALSRLGGAPLDSGRTPAQLEIRDGEILFLTPRTAAPPEVVFDDVVDAVATATVERPGRWGPATTRRFAIGFATAALLGGVAAVLLAGPPQLPGALLGLGLGGGLLLAAALVARVGGDPGTGVLFGVVALAYGGAGGLLLLAGDRGLAALGAPDVMLAGTAVTVLAAAGTAAIGAHPQVFAGGVIAGGALALAAGLTLLTGGRPAAAAVAVATVAFAGFPALPMIAYRAARLPLPAVPTGPEDLRADTGTVAGRRILELSNRAEAYHTGLIVTAAGLVAGAVVVMVVDGDWRAWLLGGVLALLLLLRARPYRGWQGRIPVLVAGSAALAAIAVVGFRAAGPPARLGLVTAGLLVAAAVALGYGMGVAGRRISPLWGRLLDIAEVILIIAVVPLAAWVAGLYGWIATVRN